MSVDPGSAYLTAKPDAAYDARIVAAAEALLHPSVPFPPRREGHEGCPDEVKQLVKE